MAAYTFHNETLFVEAQCFYCSLDEAVDVACVNVVHLVFLCEVG